MLGIAVNGGQVKRGLRHGYSFVPTAAPASIIARGLNSDLSGSCTVSSVVQDVGGNGLYHCSFVPAEEGPVALLVKDGGGAVVHQAIFDCVRALDVEHVLGLQNVYSQPVRIVPNVTMGLDYAGGLADNGIRTWCNGAKFLIPYDGLVYGFYYFGCNAVPTVGTSARFWTGYGTAPGNSVYVRDISEDYRNLVPAEGAWGASWEWKTIWLDKPLVGRAGDVFGIAGDNTGGGGTINFFRYQVPPANYAAAAKLCVMDAAPNLSAANPFSIWAGLGAVLGMYPLMAPPSIAVAGHSFWASHPGSETWAENTTGAYVAANDLAKLLQDNLGVSVVNCALGGTGLSGWVGTSGYFESWAKTLHPAVMLYDSAYNDYGVAGLTDATYVGYLDRLLAHCDQAGIELVMLEGPGSYYAEHTLASAVHIERENAVLNAWAQHHGVAVVPLVYRLGQHSGATEHLSLRRWQKHGVTGLADYDTNDGRVHLSVAGLTAAARAIAEGFKARRHVQPRLFVPRTTCPNVQPPDSAVADAATLTAINARLPNQPAAKSRVWAEFD